MSDEHLPPLQLDTSSAPELRSALSALAEEGPSRAQLEAVAGRLGALLDAAPPAQTGAGGWLRAVTSKAVVTRLAIGLLAAGSTLALLQSRSVPDRPLAVTLESAHVPPPQLAETRPAPPAVAESAPDEQTPPRENRKVARRTSVVRQRVAAQPSAARTPMAPLSAPTPMAAVAASHPEAYALPAKDAATAEPAPRPPAPSDDAQPLPRAPSEVALLVEARRLLTTQPAAALRTLDQHAARFSDGLLAPEREVLAIEALRKLGRASAAEQRLRAFRARYPDSMHLPRLANPQP